MKKTNLRLEVDKTIARLKRYFWPLLIFSVFVNALTLAMPVYMLQIYDRVMTSRNINTLIMLTIVFVGLLAIGCLLTHYRSALTGRLGARFHDKVSRLSFDLLLKPAGKEDEARNRVLGDVELVRDFIAGGNLLRLFDLPWTPVFMAVLYIVHPIIGWVAAGFALTLLLLDWISARWSAKSSRDYQKAKQLADYSLQSSIQASDVIWSMGMVKALGHRWRSKSAGMLDEMLKTYDRRASQDATRRFLQQAAQMSMLGIGAFLAVREEITAGSIVAGSIICARALTPLLGSMRAFEQFREATKAIARLRQVMTPAPEATGPIAQSQGRKLDVSNLAVGLEQDQGAPIHHLSFTLQPGRTLAVVGPSRTGKSLLAQTLVGVRAPAEGRVGLGGVDLHRHATDTTGAMIGYVPQRPTLFDGTLGENIARFETQSVEELDRVVQLAGLGDALSMLQDGYDTPIMDAARAMTQEQLRFVTLARALYGNPLLLVVDAIDAGLESSWQPVIAGVIEAGRSLGQIVIWVTDKASTVQCADLVMVLTKTGMQRLCPVHELKQPPARPVAEPSGGMPVHA